MIKVKSKKQKNLQQRGITLVALVITIIILLILAGISIAALTNQGLFNQAQNAKNVTEEKAAEERNTLRNYEEQINAIIGGKIPQQPEEPQKKQINFTLEGANGDLINITGPGIEEEGVNVDFGIGNTTKECTIDIIEGEKYTFKSNIAKDTTNGTNPYTKEIELKPETTNVKVMPEGAIYWYGNELVNINVIGGKADNGSNVSAPQRTNKLNSVMFYKDSLDDYNYSEWLYLQSELPLGIIHKKLQVSFLSISLSGINGKGMSISVLDNLKKQILNKPVVNVEYSSNSFNYSNKKVEINLSEAENSNYLSINFYNGGKVTAEIDRVWVE